MIAGELIMRKLGGMRLAGKLFLMLGVMLVPAIPGIAPGRDAGGGLTWLLEKLDRLHELDRHAAVIATVEGYERSEAHAAADESERAAVLWRRARAEFAELELQYRAEQVERDALVERLRRIEDSTERAARADQAAAAPRFWQAAAVALRAREEGRLRALRSMRDVRELIGEALERNPRIAEAHFLMGQLYRELPGRPLSWGSDRAAVSSARLAVELHERRRAAAPEDAPFVYHAFYLSLAEALYERNWSREERERRRGERRREYEAAEDALSRAAAYEGSVDLPPLSDRDEARRLIAQVLTHLSASERVRRREQLDYEHARRLQAAWR